MQALITRIGQYLTGTVVGGKTGLDVNVIGGAAGGGPATIADGADVAQGTTTDAAGTSTVIGQLKAIVARLGTLGQKTMAGSAPVVIASDQAAFPVNLQPVTSGGSGTYRSLDMSYSNRAVVKNSAGQLYGYYFYNGGTAVRFIKLYDMAANPTAGTDTPKMTFPLPAGAAANVAFPNGIAFGTGIAISATTAIADNSTADPGANEVVVNLNYK